MNFKKLFLAATLSLATLFGGPAVAKQSIGIGHGASGNPVKHVIVIVQENRTLDNLFNGFPGADTSTTAHLSGGGTTTITSYPLMGESFDLSHDHAGPNGGGSGPPYGGFITECNKSTPSGQCQMNGFDQELTTTGCLVLSGGCPAASPFHFVGPTPITNPTDSPLLGYWNIATHYLLADEVFSSNQGPSTPGHLFLIGAAAGQWPWYNAENNNSSTYGCENLDPTGPHYRTVNMNSVYPGQESFPGSLGTYNGDPVVPQLRSFGCFDMETIFDLANARGVSWRYYTAGALNDGGTVYAYWSPAHAIGHLCQPVINGFCRGPYMNNVVTPASTVISDIQNNNLASISFVTPATDNSDHASNGVACSVAPCASVSWVTSIIDCVGGSGTGCGSSQYWKDTTVIVIWDDWGGWWDHVAPPDPCTSQIKADNPDLCGFRTPMLIVSPFLKSPGTVDHRVRDQNGSMLAYIEDTFQLGNLNGAAQAACFKNQVDPCGPTMDTQFDDLFSDFDFNITLLPSFTVVRNNDNNPVDHSKVLGRLFANEIRGNGVYVPGKPPTKDELDRKGNPDDDGYDN